MKFITEYLTSTLHIDRSVLSSLLGVQDQELSDWESCETKGSAPNKAKRLVLLADIVQFLSESFPQIQESNIISVLKQKNIVFDIENQEDGNLSYIGFVASSGAYNTYRIVIGNLMDEYLKL